MLWHTVPCSFPEERLPLCPPVALGLQQMDPHGALPVRDPPLARHTAYACSPLHATSSPVRLALSEGQAEYRESPRKVASALLPRLTVSLVAALPRAGPGPLLVHLFSLKVFPRYTLTDSLSSFLQTQTGQIVLYYSIPSTILIVTCDYFKPHRSGSSSSSFSLLPLSVPCPLSLQNSWPCFPFPVPNHRL